MISSPVGATLVLVLGAALAIPATAASARPLASASLAPTARERSQLMVAEGDAAYANEHLEEAISKYRAAYYSLSPEDQASYLGSLPVRKAVRAYEQLIATEQDPARRRALLQRQLVLLVEFLDAVAGKEGAAEEIGEDLIAELEEKRRSLDDALEGERAQLEEAGTSSSPAVEPATQEDTTSSSPPAVELEADSPEPSRDWLGLGLVIGGGTAFLVGVGVGIGYSTIRSGAVTLADDRGEPYAEGTHRREVYIEREYGRADKYLVAGSIVASVGLAVAVGGVVRLVLHRRASSSTTALHVAPILAPTTAGLSLGRRF